MNIIFQIDGGVGKSIIATAVCKAIKNQYPQSQLIVITSYPDVFDWNPNVDRVFGLPYPAYFYRDYVQGKEVKSFILNPYFASDFISMKGHLIQVWCEMFGIRYNGELPELFITSREYTSYSSLFGADKPLLALQTHGGGDKNLKYSWARDLPQGTAQQIVDAFAGRYYVMHIRREDQPSLRNTIPVQMEFRKLIVLMLMSEKRLLIDSFAQHMAAALRLPSVVCWIANTPQQFGYSMHANILATPPTLMPPLRDAVFSPFNIGGSPIQFPYRNEQEIFNPAFIAEVVAGFPKIPEQPEIPFREENREVKDRILTACTQASMVAPRLKWLLDKENLNNIKQVLDIGSWHLNQSIEFAQLFPEAQVDAFEPVPASYELCQNKKATLPEQIKSRVNVHNVAMSDAVGAIPFYPIDSEKSSVPNTGASSMLKFMEGLNGTPFGQTLVQDEITVTATTLDTWCTENNIHHVDIMWVDVQGAELHVFKGAENTLKNTRIIMTEVGLKPYYEGHTLKSDIDEYLKGLGFEELTEVFELNGFDYEGNAIYVRAAK